MCNTALSDYSVAGEAINILTDYDLVYYLSFQKCNLQKKKKEV